MKRRRFSFLALLMLAVIMLMPVSIQAASKPGTVKLNSISAPAYNKINIKWKKTSGATHYIVYYKKAGTKKVDKKSKRLTIPKAATLTLLPRSIQSL